MRFKQLSVLLFEKRPSIKDLGVLFVCRAPMILLLAHCVPFPIFDLRKCGDETSVLLTMAAEAAQVRPAFSSFASCVLGILELQIRVSVWAAKHKGRAFSSKGVDFCVLTGILICSCRCRFIVISGIRGVAELFLSCSLIVYECLQSYGYLHKRGLSSGHRSIPCLCGLRALKYSSGMTS